MLLLSWLRSCPDERGPVPGASSWAPAAVRPREHWGLKWLSRKEGSVLRKRKANVREAKQKYAGHLVEDTLERKLGDVSEGYQMEKVS